MPDLGAVHCDGFELGHPSTFAIYYGIFGRKNNPRRPLKIAVISVISDSASGGSDVVGESDRERR
jgi:hypothetical protein